MENLECGKGEPSVSTDMKAPLDKNIISEEFHPLNFSKKGSYIDMNAMALEVKMPDEAEKRSKMNDSN